MDRNNAGINFFNSLNFFAFFFWNFLGRVENERNSRLNFFSLFHGLPQPVLDRNNFFNFLNFFSFFLEFSSSGWVGTEFGSKISLSLSGPSHPVLAKNNAGMRFFNFLNFSATFFGIFLPGSSMNGIRD